MKKLVFFAIAGAMSTATAVPASAEPSKNPADYAVEFCKTLANSPYSSQGQCVSAKRTANPAGFCKEMRDWGFLHGNPYDFRNQGECVNTWTEK